MDRTERLHKLIELLNRGRPVPRQVFLYALEVSLATLKRFALQPAVFVAVAG